MNSSNNNNNNNNNPLSHNVKIEQNAEPISIPISIPIPIPTLPLLPQQQQQQQQHNLPIPQSLPQSLPAQQLPTTITSSTAIPTTVSAASIPASIPASTTASTPTSTTPLIRQTLNGKWILNRNRGSPSVRGFLETMGVSDLAIEANEKGDKEHDTIHEITLTEKEYKIKKLSRVNDMTLEVVLGVEHVKSLLPGERIKRTLATSDHLGHVKVQSSMPTINGVAKVTDIKTLVQETNENTKQQSSIYVQHLTIMNENTDQKYLTTRYFIPFEGEANVTSKIAGGNNKR